MGLEIFWAWFGIALLIFIGSASVYLKGGKK